MIENHNGVCCTFDFSFEIELPSNIHIVRICNNTRRYSISIWENAENYYGYVVINHNTLDWKE